MPKFIVVVDGVEHYSDDYIIEADTEQEAKEEAEALFERDYPNVDDLKTEAEEISGILTKLLPNY